MFGLEKKKSKKVAFSIGKYSGEGGSWYFTNTHAQFALWMVVMKRFHTRKVEERFLNPYDFCVIKPNHEYDMDVNDHDDELKALPLCGLIRSGNDLVAWDCGFLRFNELRKVSRICSTNDSNVHTTIDRLKQYYNATSKTWEPLHGKRRLLYELMGARRDVEVTTLIGEVSRAHQITPPPNTKSIDFKADNWGVAVVGCKEGGRTDNHYYSPVYKYHFRSVVEVDLFKKCLAECESTLGRKNEVIAYKLFKLKWEQHLSDKKQKGQQHQSAKKRGKVHKKKGVVKKRKKTK